MGDVYPVSGERHGQRAWSKAANFNWARGDQVVRVALQEAPQLMMTLPLCFVKQDEQLLFVALLGLRPGENLFVDSAGRWMAPVVPHRLHHYPFRRMRDPDGRDILGIDEDGLLPTSAPGGAKFFDEHGVANSELTTILEQLVRGDNEREQAVRIATTLQQHDLLEPWELKVRQESGDTLNVNGLYRVSEQKLNAVPAEALLALRDSKALVLAYCQLLSMQHVQQLGRLSGQLARQRAVQAPAQPFGYQGTISFENL